MPNATASPAPRGQDGRPIHVGDTVRRVPTFSKLGVEAPSVVGVVTAIRPDGVIEFSDHGYHAARPEMLRRSRARCA